MKKNICHVIFSTNRLNFLYRTLASLRKINYDNLTVDHILIDDYPMDRNNNLFKEILVQHNFDEIILHEENKGLTKTWQEFFEYIKDRDYDYIFHNEDDVEVLCQINIRELIELLENDSSLSQLQLKRNNWYQHETENIGITENDFIYKNYRYEKNGDYFWMLMSLYPSWIAREPILETTNHNPSEYVIAKYLREKYGQYNSGIVKTISGYHIVDHIGDYSHGKRVAENEPGWDMFKYYHPEKKYCSRTGKEWNAN